MAKKNADEAQQVQQVQSSAQQVQQVQSSAQQVQQVQPSAQWTPSAQAATGAALTDAVQKTQERQAAAHPVGQAQVSGTGAPSYAYTAGGYGGEMPKMPTGSITDTLPAAPEGETVSDAPDLRPMLDQWLTAAQQQAAGQIDYATQQGITELERAQEDAQPQFQQMREQINIDEARGMDNQALYAEARGDRGGIGQAQWNSIQNTAAQNRLQVQQQQTKLATDTARAIADLRAKGEFEKADQMLELTQSYLSQLMQLEQWASGYNLSAAQFRQSVKEWQTEYQLKVAQILSDEEWRRYEAALQQYQTGWQIWTDERDFNYQQERDRISDERWRTQWDYNVSQDEQSTLSQSGWALLQQGITPSESQLAAMGMTADQAQSYITALNLQAGYTGGSFSGAGGTGGSSSGAGSTGGSSSGAGSTTGSGMPITFGGKTYEDEYALLQGMLDQYGSSGSVLNIPEKTLSELSRATQHFWGMSAADVFKALGYQVSGAGSTGGSAPGAGQTSVHFRGTAYNSAGDLLKRYYNNGSISDADLRDLDSFAQEQYGMPAWKMFQNAGMTLAVTYRGKTYRSPDALAAALEKNPPNAQEQQELQVQSQMRWGKSLSIKSTTTSRVRKYDPEDLYGGLKWQ